ncbi:MAG: hypothetical protein NVS3B2_03220 [Ramlibacter sp.]
MKRLPLFCLLAASMVGLHAETWIDNARVRRVDPQYENVSVPRNECSRQLISEAQPVNSGYGYGYGGERQYGGAVLGGVAGALLGNQVGRGHGREAATALGAVVGAFAGDQYANQGNQGRSVQYVDVPREVTSCRTVSDVQSRITGYRVQYDYHGQQYTTFSRVNPGSNLQVRVSIEPVVQ